MYSATKGAVDVITRTLAQELGPRNIRVNSLSPGLVETEGSKASGNAEGKFKSYAVSRTPLGRQECRTTLPRWLSSWLPIDSAWMTGEVLPWPVEHGCNSWRSEGRPHQRRHLR